MNQVAGWGVAAIIAVGLGAGPAMAGPDLVKKAKDAGMPAQNCQYCHTEKIPKKETFKPRSSTSAGNGWSPRREAEGAEERRGVAQGVPGTPRSNRRPSGVIRAAV